MTLIGKGFPTIETGKEVGFYTLGCKVNQYDTQAIIEQFRARGYSVVDFDQKADTYVINT